MTRVERFQPGTKVSDWASGVVTAPPTYVFPQGGFSGGGNVASGTGNSIEKMTFDTETSAVIAATLSFTATWLAALPNSGTAGYTRNGSNLNKILYATETNGSISNASSTNNYLAGAGNVGVAGYWYGGMNGGDNAEISKTVFATDASSTLSATLAASRRGTSALTNDGTAGYSAGGSCSSWNCTVIDKLTYSNDTRSTISATLDQGMNDIAGVSNKGSAGYHTAGTSNTSAIEKLTFSNETSTAISATLSTSVTFRGEFEWQANAGYITGGHSGTATTIDKLTFSGETTSTVSSGLTVGRSMHAGHGNSGGSY